MVITDFLERNARLYGSDIALVEVNPSEERDSAVTWREASLIAEAQPDAPYRRELSWRDFDRRANRFANFLLSRNVRRGTKVGILLMNCLEWLPIYFGILKAGCIAVPLNFRYASDEISYCLDLADVEVLVFGPEFVSRLDPIQAGLTRVRLRLFVGRNVPDYAEDCRRLMGFCSSSVPPIALDEDDDAAIYFSSGTTGFPKAILHRHRALVCSCVTEQHHHGQTKDDVFLCIPPLYHTGAKMHWFGSLISGGKAVLLRGVKPEWILRTVTEEKCTIVWLLVPWAQDILDAIESGRVNLEHYLLDQWRLMHIGAQPVPPSLIKRWLKYFPHHKYDTNYGLSESIGPGCVHLGVDNIEKIGAIGKAGYLWQTRILDERGNDVAPGEIGELAVSTQVKLLRVLQEQEFERLGGMETRKVDVRVVAATSRNLEQMVKDGLFRRDLYYRLNVGEVHVPPLRRRKEDIGRIVLHVVSNAMSIYLSDLFIRVTIQKSGAFFVGFVLAMLFAVSLMLMTGRLERIYSGYAQKPPEEGLPPRSVEHLVFVYLSPAFFLLVIVFVLMTIFL